MMKDQSFRAIFQALTENDPFPWQEKLFLRLVAGELPRHCDVPTGLGKTSVIAVWLAALGVSILEPARYRRIPRRLAYIVDRRVVVDQATDEVESLRERLARAGKDESLIALRPIVDALMQATTVSDDCGVTVSTLRGKFADNHAWHLDPSRPAIIVGTVDMIGSRMLFSGYGGVGRNWRSLQAGLLLRDTWVVLDESHLVPSFESLLTGMELHAKCGISMCPFGITRMSATLAAYHSDAESKIATTEKPLFDHTDMEDSRVAKRLNAPKSLRFVLAEAAVSASNPSEKRAAMAEKMAREAIILADGKSAVVVFANTVDLVKAVTVAIEKHISKEWSKRVLMLTGEMRGFERDKLTTNEVLAAFSPKRDRSRATTPAFLVATACVEVGMDFDADHAVCDAVALERMIQRFGRVNRRGEVNAKIRLVLSAEVATPTVGKIANIAPADASVLTLRQLPASDDAFDASPAALRALDFTSPLARRAFSPPPESPPLDEARLDDWSLTSLRSDEFPRPQVSYWLRGVTEDESMTTSLVWRADLCIAASREDAAEMMDTIPVSQNEVAQVATHRAAALLSALAKKNANALLVIRSVSGESRSTEMSEFEDAGKRLGELVSATVFLPSGVGGMLKDIPDSSPEALKEPVADVINEAAWRRAVFTQSGTEIEASLLRSKEELEPLGTYADEAGARNAVVAHLRSLNPGMLVRFEALIGDLSVADSDLEEEQAQQRTINRAVAYFQIATDNNSGGNEDNRSLAKYPVTLAEHTRVTEAVARTLGERLGLAADLREAITLAARWHDRGKDRRWWQAAIGNTTGEPLAKSGQAYFDHSYNAGYRHEFGSLIEARDDETLHDHPQRELILHLIAAHHGHARPSFPAEAYDRTVPTTECAAIAAEVPRRFVALQQHYGWWTLAWLEALVKCADAIASAHPDWTAK
jgi:CRISPR-associated endonuclease/helicase Cas3